jgi:hypothetical protein
MIWRRVGTVLFPSRLTFQDGILDDRRDFLQQEQIAALRNMIPRFEDR